MHSLCVRVHGVWFCVTESATIMTAVMCINAYVRNTHSKVHVDNKMLFHIFSQG